MDPFVAEIRILPFNFAPRGWAMCNGQILPIAQNTALFSLLGTTYGGDGRSTFALPNLQSASPMHPGQGPGLSLHVLGESGGVEQVTLTTAQLPAHTHTVSGGASGGTTADPTNAVWAQPRGSHYATPGEASAGSMALPPVGGNQPHNNLPSYLVLNFCIALQGVYPPRG